MSETHPKSDRHLHLLIEYGALRPSWQWKERGAEYGRLPSLDDFVSLTSRAEGAGFEAVFFADFLGVNRQTLPTRATIPFEPLTLLAAVAARTEQIGLIATASTLFSYPYTVARQFASLDHLSAGRAGWNVVTSFAGEKNYGFDTLPSPDERYERAQEFVDIVRALWDSWNQGATIADAAIPEYVDVDRVRDIGYEGAWHRVEGALDLPTPVQGHPVLFQAGASGPGVAFSARNADATFIASPNLEHAQKFRADLNAELAVVGRAADAVRVMPGLRVVLADTDEEAHRIRRSILERVPLEALRSRVESEFENLDLGGIGWDDPIPADRFPSEAEIATFGRRRSRAALYREAAYEEGVTLRDFLRAVQNSGAHLTLVGSAVTVADEIERWYRSGAVDGFLLGESEGIERFFDDVVPELTRRGITRARPVGSTLREHLGLDVP